MTDLDRAKAWLSDGHGACWRWEPTEDEAREVVRSLAAMVGEVREEEREKIRALFVEGVKGGWPDDREDDPENWETWWLRLYGEEAGDMLEFDQAWEHFARGLRGIREAGE